MLLRLRHLSTLSVLALALTTSTLHAQQPSEPKTQLGKHMAAMNGAFRTIGQQVADSTKNASTMEQLTIFETNAKEALAFEPEKKAQVPEADQAKFVADYKAGLQKLIDTAGKLHGALHAGKNTEAAAIVEEMRGLQRTSHGEFRIRRPPPAN
ncbi:MAG TPA: cytochrome b562 [Gemmatimonas sp.]|uniref:cytochrome b562 n=1 Tax=Gemmatimonas sp. TaxID=1962908 RepID=UPI002ED9CD9C